MAETTFPVGKLPADVLRSVIARIPIRDPRVSVGPQIGEDAAVIDLGDRALVVSTDPITFAAARIGRHAVHVNANDVAVMGARPAWFFAVLLLPPSGATRALVESIMGEMQAACDGLGVTLCGGHTEITEGLGRPIVVGQMIGEVAPDRLKRKDRVLAGDRILLTSGIAVEGTAILARERRDALSVAVGADLVARAERFIADPGISIVRAALTAANASAGVHAMHDPTEGGLAGGLCELVAPAALGLHVVRERIRIFAETQAICDALSLDPMGLLASGALLIAVAPAAAPAVLRALADEAIPAADIGEVRPAGDGLTIRTAEAVEMLRPPPRDEIARALVPDREG